MNELSTTGFLLAFIWAVRSGQFDDKYTPSIRFLFDDKKNMNKNINEEFRNVQD